MGSREYREISFTFNDLGEHEPLVTTWVFFVCGDCSAVIEVPEKHDEWHDGVSGRWPTKLEVEDARSSLTDY